MANLFASPTVSPSKSLQLLKTKTHRQVKPAASLRLKRLHKCQSSRHKLGVVVLHPQQEVILTPRQELVQRGF